MLKLVALPASFFFFAIFEKTKVCYVQPTGRARAKRCYHSLRVLTADTLFSSVFSANLCLK